MHSLPLYTIQTVPATTPARVGDASPRRLVAVILVAGSANATLELKNAATDTGTVLLNLAALANTTTGIDLTGLGGMTFDTAMYCKPAGSGAICYVWYE